MKNLPQPPRYIIYGPTPEETGRYLGHNVVIEVLTPNGKDVLVAPAAGRVVVVSAGGIILRDTTDYTESFLAYTEIASIRRDPVR